MTNIAQAPPWRETSYNRLQQNDKEYKIITFETKVDLKFVEAEKTFSPPVHIRVLMLHMQATQSVYS